MQAVSFYARQFLDCVCNGNTIICVDPSLVLGGAPYVNGTFAFRKKVNRGYGPEWLYSFSYEESQLVDPTKHLISTDVKGAFCDDCLITFIEYLAAAGGAVPITVIDTNTVNLTANGALNHTLKADVKISATIGNALQVFPDGIGAIITYNPDCPAIFFIGTSP